MRSVIKSILLLTTIVFGVFHKLHAQQKITFAPKFQEKTMKLNMAYQLGADTVKVESLRFFVAHIKLFKGKKEVFTSGKKHYLIDIEKPNSMAINLALPKSVKYNTIYFQLGVDSATNVSGAYGGDLDPVNGMYWTWQSGYINFKLEGTSSLCQTRHNQFQFHLGGYQYPYNNLQKIKLKVNAKKNITINMAIDKLLAQTNLQVNNTIMSPGKAGMIFGENLVTIFTIP